LPQHLGGYLPFQYELTDRLRPGENVLALTVDSRWSNVPPEGAAVGAKRIDYLEPGGIHRSAQLELVPPIFIADVFAKPVRVLDPDRQLEVICTLDAAALPPQPLEVQAELKSGARVLAGTRESLQIAAPGQTEFKLTLSNLG